MDNKAYDWFLFHPEIESKYSGEYIAITKEGIVAHGKDFKQVFKEAKKYGDEPFFHKVPHWDKELVV